MAAGDLVDWYFNLGSSHRIELGYEVGHSSFPKDDFDIIVVSLGTLEGKELVSWKVSISIHNLLRYGIQRHDHSTDVFLDSLCGNVLY